MAKIVTYPMNGEAGVDSLLTHGKLVRKEVVNNSRFAVFTAVRPNTRKTETGQPKPVQDRIAVKETDRFLLAVVIDGLSKVNSREVRSENIAEDLMEH